VRKVAEMGTQASYRFAEEERRGKCGKVKGAEDLLNYYTNHCTYIKFIKFTH